MAEAGSDPLDAAKLPDSGPAWREPGLTPLRAKFPNGPQTYFGRIAQAPTAHTVLPRCPDHESAPVTEPVKTRGSVAPALDPKNEASVAGAPVAALGGVGAIDATISDVSSRTWPEAGPVIDDDPADRKVTTSPRSAAPVGRRVKVVPSPAMVPVNVTASGVCPFVEMPKHADPGAVAADKVTMYSPARRPAMPD